MVEVTGNLWDYPATFRVITTNGYIKKSGECVMGRGCAREAVDRYPGIQRKLASWIREGGNHVYWLYHDLITFPVKHNWWEKADLDLIKKSTGELQEIGKFLPTATFVIPRPGCGNGKLQWVDVKPVLSVLSDRYKVITK